MTKNPISYKFFKDFTNRVVFISRTPFPTFLNTGTTDGTFQQPGKQDSFGHKLESSASMYKSSGSQFFRTTTGIQSGPDAFDKSRLVIIFLTNVGVKSGKEIAESSRLEFLEMFLASYFALSDVEGNTFGPLKRGGITGIPLLRTLLAIRQKSLEPSFRDVKDSLFY